jgi:hypothetical protein
MRAVIIEPGEVLPPQSLGRSARRQDLSGARLHPFVRMTRHGLKAFS